MDSDKKQMFRYKKRFEKAVSRAQMALKNGNLNSTIAWAQISADYAWQTHLGFYTSVELESLLLDVANRLNSPNEVPVIAQRINSRNTNQTKKHVLHVMTQAYKHGGHTRVVSAWIQNTLDTAVSSVVTTVQRGPLPDDLSSSVTLSGGNYFSLSAFSSNLLTRSLLLRQLSQKWADLVVLHIHPWDGVPMVAFGVEGGPPIIVFNHSDFTFWLGASVADIVADLRPTGQRISIDRRGVNNSKILPIPMLKAETKHDRKVLRKKFGIKEEHVVLLTVGTEHKYTPFGRYDFVRTMAQFMKRNPSVVLIAVGPRHHGRWARASDLTRGRIRAMGFVDWSDLHALYDCADIFVDGFPMGGMTAMLESGLRGIPLIGLRIQEAPILNDFDDVAFVKFQPYVSSLETFTGALESMISQPSLRCQRVDQIKENIERYHFPPEWNNSLETMIQSLGSGHEPKLPGSAKSSYETPDKFLAGFQTAVLEDRDYKSYFCSMLLENTKYLSGTERIMSIPDILLKTNSPPTLKSAIYALRKSLFMSQEFLANRGS